MAPGNDLWNSNEEANDGGWKPNGGVSVSDGWQPDQGGDINGFTGGDFAPENISKHANDDDAPADGGCRICHEDSHFARDCPSRTDACFNCGESGHNKADCVNPRVEREFTGECNYCHTVGHRAAECPSKPAQACRVCQSTEHIAKDCTVNRLLAGVADVGVEEAWAMVEKADEERDVIDIKKAILIYACAFPALTWTELESVFRESKMKTFLIAKKQEVSKAHTIINLQGEAGQEFVTSFQFSAQPRRAKFAEGWPASPEENMERLAKAGLPIDSLIPVCRNCDEAGHTAKKCPQEKIEKPKQDGITCAVCSAEGHLARDCSQPRKTGKECRVCQGTDHIARDCPEKEAQLCRNCNQEGHQAKECPEPKNPATSQCRNCDEFGHTGRECPKPRDYSRVKCNNCGQLGHTVVRCKEPVAENGDGDGNGGGDGGWGGEGDQGGLVVGNGWGLPPPAMEGDSSW